MNKYRVTRTYIHKKTGNPYFPKIYEGSRLPEELKNNKLYCVPLNEKVAVIKKEIKKEEMNYKENKIKDAVIRVEHKVINKTDDKKVNLNTATLEQLVTISGIGQSSAEKIIKNRPIHNIKDLEYFLKNTSKINKDLLEV